MCLRRFARLLSCSPIDVHDGRHVALDHIEDIGITQWCISFPKVLGIDGQSSLEASQSHNRNCGRICT